MTELTTTGAGYSRAPDFNWPAGTATGAVAVLAGPIPRTDRIISLLAERLMPISSSGICPQVQRAALPAPGDDNELFRAIANALERPLNPDGPSWECWIIEALARDRWAILMKIGHELADHLPPAHLVARICDAADPSVFADSSVAQAVSPNTSPSWAEPMRQAAARAVDGLSTAAGALRAWAAGGTRAPVRHYRAVAVPRGDVDRIAGKLGVGTDAVALAAITEGLRAHLLHQGNPPKPAGLRAVGTALTHLPVEHRDPLVQLRAVHAQAGPRPAADSPAALCGRVFHAFSRSPQQAVMLSTTPLGPRYQLQLLGRTLERLLPIPPTAPGHDTGVAVLSYGNEVTFGITTDYDATPDILAAGIESGMARLVALSRDSVVLFDRRKRRARTPSKSAARWRPSPPPARVRH